MRLLDDQLNSQSAARILDSVVVCLFAFGMTIKGPKYICALQSHLKLVIFKKVKHASMFWHCT